jgi:uncharacterized membrane protein YsdA (DUF1294 family)
MQALFQLVRDIPTLNLLAYLTLVNVITFLAYWADKRAAVQGGWRISESTLHMLMLSGGMVGAWVGQRRLRHKTTKQPFQTVFKLLVVVQVIAVVAYIIVLPF